MVEKLYTQHEFEQRTGKSRTWQWRARKSGKLGYYRINAEIRYSEKHIQAFLEKCEVIPINQNPHEDQREGLGVEENCK